jgi:methyl coenzyme M reductase subunit D
MLKGSDIAFEINIGSLIKKKANKKDTRKYGKNITNLTRAG